MRDIMIHAKAIVETNKIGTGTKIWAYTHILPDAVIGHNCNICDQCFIENKVVIGDDVTVKCGVYMWDGITVENKVFIGPAVVFTNDTLPRSKNRNYLQKKTLLREGCSIGANATILPGITVGKYAMIGAGSVVTKDVDEYELVYGNPATMHGYVCECGEKLNTALTIIKCVCGKNYKFNGKFIKLI